MTLSILAFNASAANATTFVNVSPILVPGGQPGITNGPANPYPSSINVAGMADVTTDVNVTLNGLSHTWPDDLDIVLVGPAGQRAILLTDAGGDGNVSNINVTFDDAAAFFVPDAGPLTAGTWRPTPAGSFSTSIPTGPFASSLATFNGSNPNGNWALHVYDDSGGDVGQIASGWTLNITASASPPVVTSFTPSDGYVGDQVTITGSNLSGATSVTFNGVSATFSVNSPTQITTTVPNGASAGAIAVTTAGGTGSSSTFFVVKHRRSITLDVSGRKARGRVDVDDGFDACATGVEVVLKYDGGRGGFRSVGTDITDNAGRFVIRGTRQPGRYRAIAILTTLVSGDICNKRSTTESRN